jgi:hypothetical protein
MMWVILNNAFFSIVAHRAEPDKLLVRARSEGDIEKYFPRHEVTTNPTADYRYRAVVSRELVGKVLSEIAMDIDYDNFKNSIPKEEARRKGPYLEVWGSLHRLQPGT